MIYLPRRKITVFVVFLILFILSIHIQHNQTADVFSKSASKRVVLDSGHGLPDGGAIGVNGTIESSVNIKIAKELKKNLEKKGYTVIMTRKDENSLDDTGKTIAQKKKNDMHKRLNIINTSDADMFVSIHMNKFSDRRYRGAQVIYSSNFRESEILASAIQEKLHSLPDNKSKRTQLKAPPSIFLLKNAQIPAVLIECGFLSNPDEEILLNSPRYQKQLAQKILEGIEKYYERTANKNENIRN